MTDRNPPIKKYVLGSVTCSVWENTNTYQDGNTSVTHSFTFQKSYKAQDGSFQSTSNFNSRDLPALLLIVKKVAEKSIKAVDPKPRQQSGYAAPNNAAASAPAQNTGTQNAAPANMPTNNLDDVPF
jgi:hypothetical protein